MIQALFLIENVRDDRREGIIKIVYDPRKRIGHGKAENSYPTNMSLIRLFDISVPQIRSRVKVL